MMWPALVTRREGVELTDTGAQLEALLQSDDFYAHLSQIQALASTIEAVYRRVYATLHAERSTEYRKAEDELLGQAEWLRVPDELRELRDATFAPITSRACAEMDPIRSGMVVCVQCRATLSQMESDRAALPAIKAQVLDSLKKMAPAEPDDDGLVEHVKLLDYFQGRLDSIDAVDMALGRLRAALEALISEGVQIVLE